MPEWSRTARDALARGPTALVTVLATEGSAPRGAGTRMVVTADAAEGTIGGGALEFRAVDQARLALAQPTGSWRIQDLPLGPLLGQCCGGRVRLLVEHLRPEAAAWLAEARDGVSLVSTLHSDWIDRTVTEDLPPPTLVWARPPQPAVGDVLIERLGQYRRPVLLFGAGHVGRAIALAAERLPLSLAWFDTRPEAAAHLGVALTDDEGLAECLVGAAEDAAVLVLTHDHALDYRLTLAALDSRAAYIGLIGSRTKRARFLSRFKADGVPDAALARLTCPIGMPDIVGKEPEVIAVATLAQLLALPAPPA